MTPLVWDIEPTINLSRSDGQSLPVPCRADGLLGDAHDAVDGLIVHAHFVEDEEEGVDGGLLIIRKSRGTRCNICV